MGTTQKNFHCIAVDMGAGSIRVMLGMIDREGIYYKEVHRMTNEIVQINGHDRWEIHRMISEIKVGIGKAIESSSFSPSSIGVDAWGVDFVLLNDQGELVDMPVAYRDTRTEAMRERWREFMPEMETFSRTGINFYIFNTLFQLLSMKDSPEIRKTSRILFIPCYINYLLTGQARNELTISSTTQMLGITGDQWDSEILGKLNIEKGLLGQVIAPGTHLGPVHIPEAKGTGMEGIAVCSHDTASVVASLPVENPNHAFISAGTWCIVGIESELPLISEEALKLGLTNERGYNNSYRVLKNIVGLWLVQGLKKHLPDHTTYAEMEEMAGNGGAALQVIDPDDPGFYNPEDMKEAFDQYLKRTDQPKPSTFGAYLQCAYDSLCFSFRYHLERLEELSGRPIEVIHLVGGGSQSETLNQRIATICGRKVISGPVEGAILGNIMVQGIAMGRIESLQKGRELVRQSCSLKRYKPLDEQDQTEERYHRFLKLKEP